MGTIREKAKPGEKLIDKDKKSASKDSAAKLKLWGLLIGLIVVVVGSILFAVAVSGGFDNVSRATIDEDFLCQGECKRELLGMSPELYNRFSEKQKSFVVMIDQEGCTTADRLKDYITIYASEHGFRPFMMMFEDMKETSLYDSVKFYPSVVVISEGKVIGFLRADADEDSDAYNKYNAFENWMSKYLNS